MGEFNDLSAIGAIAPSPIPPPHSGHCPAICPVGWSALQQTHYSAKNSRPPSIPQMISSSLLLPIPLPHPLLEDSHRRQQGLR